MGSSVSPVVWTAGPFARVFDMECWLSVTWKSKEFEDGEGSE